jgi:hypothetical protein
MVSAIRWVVVVTVVVAIVLNTIRRTIMAIPPNPIPAKFVRTNSSDNLRIAEIAMDMEVGNRPTG